MFSFLFYFVITIYFIFFFVLLFPLANFFILLLHGSFFRSKNELFKQLFPAVSVFNLFLTALLIVFCFIEFRTSVCVTEYFFGTFYLSHPGYVPDLFGFFNRLDFLDRKSTRLNSSH